MKLKDLLKLIDPNQDVIIYTKDNVGLGNHYASTWVEALGSVEVFLVDSISSKYDAVVLVLSVNSSYATKQLDINANQTAINKSLRMNNDEF